MLRTGRSRRGRGRLGRMGWLTFRLSEWRRAVPVCRFGRSLPDAIAHLRVGHEQDCTKWRGSVSIGYEHKTALEGRCAIIRSSDPVLPFHPCDQSGEDKNSGAAHRFCECCPSRRHEYDFEQHCCPAGRHRADRGKMRERVTKLLNEPHGANPALTSRFHTRRQARAVGDAGR